MEATRNQMSPGESTNSCEQCGANFPNTEALMRHQNLAHPSGPGGRNDPAHPGPPGEPRQDPEVRTDESEMVDQRSPLDEPGTSEPGPEMEEPEPGDRRREGTDRDATRTGATEPDGSEPMSEERPSRPSAPPPNRERGPKPAEPPEDHRTRRANASARRD